MFKRGNMIEADAKLDATTLQYLVTTQESLFWKMCGYFHSLSNTYQHRATAARIAQSCYSEYTAKVRRPEIALWRDGSGRLRRFPPGFKVTVAEILKMILHHEYAKGYIDSEVCRVLDITYPVLRRIRDTEYPRYVFTRGLLMKVEPMYYI